MFVSAFSTIALGSPSGRIAISLLANNNSFSMKQIQDYAGHGDFLTTFNVYSHADDSAKKTEMDYITSCFTDLFGSSDDE
ncbi:hypothetical protein [Ruminococcus flavefaciens]|uniref:hypothetical protein n=1 Tax=Ruminococcus flavefaciens TaxID=1265 RepID=UPI0002DB06A1|nr:hypothetical protein [Ruminococcus flavefaciens]